MRGRLELTESAQRVREIDPGKSLESSIVTLPREADSVGRVVLRLFVSVAADGRHRHPGHALGKHGKVWPP